jgi:hypothetical protein
MFVKLEGWIGERDMNLFPGKKFHTINHKIDANINTVSNR